MSVYVVRKGDTLGSIATRFYGDASRYLMIAAVNRIADPDRLVVGQELVIPEPPGGAPIAPPPSPVPHVPPVPAPAGPDRLSASRLAQLHPIVAIRGRAMLELCTQAGVAVLVTQGVRTWEEQDALYARGRTVPPIGPRHIVTKAKGGQSYHNFGLAFDIVVLDAVGKADWDATHPAWTRAAELGKSVGLEWGGDWKGFKDRPHFQYVGGISLAECRELYAAGGLNAVWARVA